MTSFPLPDLGEGLHEAEIVTWHVSAGDHVVSGQPLVSVETDKAVVEIPAPYSGTVRELFCEAGDMVKTGAAIVEIETGEAEDAAAIVGDIPKVDEPTKTAAIEEVTQQQPTVAGQVRATPAVRKLAGDHNVDLQTIHGSGPGGAILSEDVLAHSQFSIEGQKLRGVRRSMAAAMTKSHAAVVPATITDRADISGWDDGEAPMVRLAQAVVVACSKEPALNAWFDGTRYQICEDINLAVAVDTPAGLFAPVLRDAGRQTDIGKKISELRRAVEDRTIAAQDLKGATITLSNFGNLGGEHAALVVSPPQVAILGAGRIGDACIPVDGKPAVRRILPLSLTFDHRVITGGEAARFLQAVVADLGHQ